MNKSTDNVYFVYDGDCPLCCIAAKGIRIRQAVGQLHLINARDDDAANPILQVINAKGFNLDKGMVICLNNSYYYGIDALHMMALLSSNHGWFNRVNYLLFRSKILAKLCYPIMRSIRKLLLWHKGIQPLNNLNNNKQPIFQAIFADSWTRLPAVMHKHYANRPYSNDVVTIEGIMDVTLGRLMRIFAPLFRALTLLAPYAGKNVPVTVHFRSEKNSKAFCFDRAFYFPNQPVYYFRSRMLPIGGNEVVEYMRFGIGWHGIYSYADNKVMLQHKRYVWKIFGIHIPIPLTLLLGKGYAQEHAVSDDTFAMSMQIRHRLWGLVYAYSGTFKVLSK